MRVVPCCVHFHHITEEGKLHLHHFRWLCKQHITGIQTKWWQTKCTYKNEWKQICEWFILSLFCFKATFENRKIGFVFCLKPEQINRTKKNYRGEKNIDWFPPIKHRFWTTWLQLIPWEPLRTFWNRLNTVQLSTSLRPFVIHQNLWPQGAMLLWGDSLRAKKRKKKKKWRRRRRRRKLTPTVSC